MTEPTIATEAKATTTNQNLATQERLTEGINSGNLSVMYDVFAPEVVDHDPAPGQEQGPKGFEMFFTSLRNAFPDATITGDHIVCDKDNVAVAYTLTGTHRGEFLGVLATGKRISVRGMQIARFENGMIAERWGSTDELGILKQLGVDPASK
ncbi:MAG: ester cyclase [Chloroflexota bacterium]